MRDKPLDPRRLDVRRFAADGGRLAGTLAAAELPRLVADAPLAQGQPARWTLTGEQRSRSGGVPEVWLHVHADAVVTLPCQRCLQPVTVALVSDRAIRFVADEAEAERLDEASEDDVLAWPARGAVDALALVEDELILSLPIVPRHEVCPQPLVVPDDAGVTAGLASADAAEPVRPNPFAALAALRTTPTAGPGDAAGSAPDDGPAAKPRGGRGGRGSRGGGHGA